MKALFADTSFYLALLRERDVAHRRAWTLLNTRPPIVTTEFVFLEFGNACSRAEDHEDFLTLYEGARKSSNVQVIPLDSKLLDHGIGLMTRRLDKDWSLTDCISFLVMEELGLSEALTGDRHFEQAGFKALLA